MGRREREREMEREREREKEKEKEKIRDIRTYPSHRAAALSKWYMSHKI